VPFLIVNSNRKKRENNGPCGNLRNTHSQIMQVILSKYYGNSGLTQYPDSKLTIPKLSVNKFLRSNNSRFQQETKDFFMTSL